ncbi:class I SAM-dependent rRNA methyltransferase [Candidatus Binatia bacterium]|nr:class I SAM-dependent rRNA methyltransferase [Candidatus Binatia bacterium]
MTPPTHGRRKIEAAAGSPRTILTLKPGRERPLRLGHPWVFAGAFADLPADTPAGAIVDVHAADGTFCGRGYANPRCTIAVRLLTRHDETIDAAFVRHRIEAALALRRSVVPPGTDAYRLLNGEGDFLPGIVVDVYGRVAVLQCLTAGADALKPWLLAALQATLAPDGVWERSTGAVRHEEGLEAAAGCVLGTVPDEDLWIVECGHRFAVDIRHGQKTGFFLDQRDNRMLVARLASGRRVLNAFAYTGAFGVYAAAGGAAHVVAVETSVRSLETARRNWEANGLPAGAGDLVHGDTFEYLRDTAGDFDLMVLDPPALVKRRGDLERGIRKYRELHRAAFRRTAPGALVFTFSCSQHVSLDAFRGAVHAGAATAGRPVQVLQHLGPGADHPIDLAHDEGGYLKGLLLRVGG